MVNDFYVRNILSICSGNEESFYVFERKRSFEEYRSQQQEQLQGEGSCLLKLQAFAETERSRTLLGEDS